MFEVAWDDEYQSIIRVSIDEIWSLQDYAEASARTLELIEGKSHRLDMINLIGPQAMSPHSFIDLFHATLRQMPRQFVMIVTVNGGDLAVALAATLEDRMALTNVPFKLLTADSLEQAHALIAEDRAQTGNRITTENVDSSDADTSF